MTDKDVAVVVGVGPGLGWALCKRFAAGGMTVALAARRKNDLDRLLSEIPLEGARSYGCDVTDAKSVATLFESVDREMGVPRLVAFNAGAFKRGSVLETDPAEFERCWRVGCLGGFHVGQQAAQRMVERGEGTIIFTGATAALRGGASFANLAVPKFGLRALAQSMARELGPQGIHVAHVVIDGQISSARSASLAAERGPDALLEPDAIAEAYWTLYRQQRSAWTQELDLRPWVERF